METWRELRRREEFGEKTRIYKNQKEDAEHLASCEDVFFNFSIRRFEPGKHRTIAQWWLIAQVFGLAFLYSVYKEITAHQLLFKEKIAKSCQSRQHDLCVGPEWRIAFYEEFTLGGNPSKPTEKTIPFSTLSKPPTAMVVVDPISSGNEDLNTAHYTAKLTRVRPADVEDRFVKTTHGFQALTFEDRSLEVGQQSTVDWSLVIQHRIPKGRAIRYIVYVEETALDPRHLEKVQGLASCNFESTWKAFNLEHQGHRLHFLPHTDQLLLWGMVVSMICMYFVYSTLRVRNEKFISIASIIKFTFADFPIQIGLMTYLLAWYDRSGLRCQLCLFSPDHCDIGESHYLHFSNMMACLFILVSCAATPVVFFYVKKRSSVYTEDELFMIWVTHAGIMCMATLPFSTGLLFASSQMLTMPTMAHIAAAVPCAIGWVTLFFVLCCPIISVCDEFDDHL